MHFDLSWAVIELFEKFQRRLLKSLAELERLLAGSIRSDIVGRFEDQTGIKIIDHTRSVAEGSANIYTKMDNRLTMTV